MGRTSTNLTTITCDLKECKKEFLLHDDPANDTLGIENVWRLTNAEGREFYFCCLLHAITFGSRWIKSEQAVEKQEPPKKSGITREQFETLKTMGIIVEDKSQAESRAHMAVEELETLPAPAIPPEPEDLNVT